ncbi:MDR family oxidoreductase [Serratia microhaemolytica]|uniref:acrylyl-CoA reductase (NADPH) n=1 Tax=Serratia microhaemolytica TaxID=2675110 RepID=UPI000FDDEE01|nr:MDR family oxidoreductase [Serratia microhaemolytica]
MFKAILIEKDQHGGRAELADLAESQLPAGDVTIAVDYSSLNYKDGLAITGQAPVVRQFPMVAGIDLAGTVIASQQPDYRVGDQVLANGWGLGEKHWGGLAQMARVNGAWLIRLPAGLTPRQAMSIGTAGYTAMLAVIALEDHGISPKSGKILVTGACGGVGSFAVALLSRLGYQVIAATGRPEQAEYLLTQLGAIELIDRQSLATPSKPLMAERWIGAIDSVGSHTLANVCASTAYGGVVAACGLAQGLDFSSSVAPFILRGVTLAGIDSVFCRYQQRVAAWQRLAQLIEPALLPLITTEIGLSEVIPAAAKLMAGEVRGRLLVNVAK